jgi:hypothetical protein
LWIDINKYVKNKVDIEHMAMLIDNIDEDDKKILEEILHKPKCNDLLRAYLKYKGQEIINLAISKFGKDCSEYLKVGTGTSFYTGKIATKISIYDARDRCSYSYDVLEVDDILCRIDKQMEINRNLNHKGGN